jgi:hypothetical protein
MEDDDKDLLQKTYDLAKENNHMLKGLRNSHRWSMFFNFTKWVIIVGASVGVFYFLQPYVDKMMNVYNDIQSSIGNVKTVTNKLPKI